MRSRGRMLRGSPAAAPDPLGGPEVTVFSTGNREQKIAAEREQAALQEARHRCRRVGSAVRHCDSSGA